MATASVVPTAEISASQPRSVAEYALANGKVILGLQGEPPPWVEPTLKALGRLLQLPSNWNSYNARPIDPAAVWSAWAVLTAIMREDSPAPAVVPTATGGVQLEWHAAGIDLEFEVASPQYFRLSVEAGDNRVETEDLRELSVLAAWVARLSDKLSMAQSSITPQ